MGWVLRTSAIRAAVDARRTVQGRGSGRRGGAWIGELPADRRGRRRYFLGVDVGGTFTDVVLGDTDGGVAVAKVTTTPDDPRHGVVAGIGEVLATHGVDPSRVTRLVHGTTLATNVILETAGQ